MNCREFEEKLHLLADPDSPLFLRRAGDAHAAVCPRCRQLRAIAAGETEPFDSGGAEDLTASILRRTTGPMCSRIDKQICDWVDGALPESDAELLRMHMECCPGCRSIAAVLVDLRETLPLLAEIAPDARFVRDVLDRTVHAGRRNPTPVGALERWLSRLSQRPRIAQEIAYVAAMLLFLLVGPPPQPLGRPGSGDSGTGRPLSMTAVSGLGQGVEALSDMAGNVGDVIEDLAAGHPAPDLQARVPGIARTIARIDGSGEWLSRDAHRAAAALIRLDTVEIWSAFAECRDGIRDCWEDSKSTEPSVIPLRSPGVARQPEEQRRHEEDANHDHDARGDGAE